MEIKPIRKVNVGEMVFNQLQDLLIRGEWKPGDRLPSENELAELFHVSRITVRQALQKLSAMGLIETRLGEGSFVRKVDASESMNALVSTLYLDNASSLQVFEFREILDTEAAGLAVERGTEAEIQELEIILHDMRRYFESKLYDEFAKKDLEFHFQISKMTKNKFLIQTNMILKKVLEISMEDVVNKMGCEPALYYHQAILDAIRKKNKKEAMCLMREHIRRNATYYDENAERMIAEK